MLDPRRCASPDGVLRGKEAIADYWRIGLATQPPLRHWEDRIAT